MRSSTPGHRRSGPARIKASHRRPPTWPGRAAAFTGLTLACMAAPGVQAAPNCADLSGLQAVEAAGQPVADWTALLRLVRPDAPPAESEAEALKTLCGDALGTCLQRPGLHLVDDGVEANFAVVLVAPEGTRVWPNAFETSGTSVSSAVHDLGDGLFHISVEFEWQERVPFCPTEEDEREDNCGTATGVVSSEYRDLVLDTRAHQAVWRASCSVSEAGGKAHRVERKGAEYIWNGCEKLPAPVRFDRARLLACPPPKPTAETTESASSPGSTPVTDSARTEPSPTRMTPAARKAALARARKQLKDKQFAAALATFDTVVGADATDLAAVAERGFARLLAGRFDEAEADLNRCARDVPETDVALRAQVFFNLGLLAEKRNEPTTARNHFQRSHGYKPTSATEKRLAAPAPAP